MRVGPEWEAVTNRSKKPTRRKATATDAHMSTEAPDCKVPGWLPAGPPAGEPIGLQLSRTSKVVSRAFDAALAEAGGSLPTWLVLVSLKAQRHGAQRDLAEAVGIEGPTLTHHLNRMEAAGLLTRTRDPANRRVHRVDLTEAGEAAFERLRAVALAFDQHLRSVVTKGELETMAAVLGRLRARAEWPPRTRQT
jgi:MarR family transcriptional regulator for hemolysin